MTTWGKLSARSPLFLKGFETLYHNGIPYSPESHVQLQINDKSYQENYDQFIQKILKAIGKNFLPIYRMADGEFLFIRSIESYGFLERFNLKKMKTCWGENYTFRELKSIKSSYIEQLKLISNTGYFAMHLIDKADGGHDYYPLYKFVTEWFDRNNIDLTENNYTSFYYVYAMLSSEDRFKIIKDRNILIITSIDKIKEMRLRQYVMDELHARSIQFINISATKSMTQEINLQNITGKIDIALIAAGIGSSNIIKQCKSLNTVCIDAGIIIERFCKVDLAKTRFFIL